MDPDFEELSNDLNIIHKVKQYSRATDDIDKLIKLVSDSELYDTLPNVDKIKYNLMMSFALNSLFWIYLRAEGVDPLNHPVKNENTRLKQAMARAQEIRDRQTMMPRLNKDVAKRFIRNGLWAPNDACEGTTADSDLSQEGNCNIEHQDQSISRNSV